MDRIYMYLIEHICGIYSQVYTPHINHLTSSLVAQLPIVCSSVISALNHDMTLGCKGHHQTVPGNVAPGIISEVTNTVKVLNHQLVDHQSWIPHSLVITVLHWCKEWASSSIATSTNWAAKGNNKYDIELKN